MTTPNETDTSAPATVTVNGVTWTKEQQTTERHTKPRMVWLRPVSLGYRLAEDCSPDLTPYLDHIAALTRQRDEALKANERLPVAHVCHNGKLKNYSGLLCSACRRRDDLTIADLTRQLADAQATVARMREALEQIVVCECRYRVDPLEHAREAIGYAQDVARAALALEKTPDV